jgi:uncharacterized repeat protein (TIGR01451 family)
VYIYGSPAQFPTYDGSGANYWVDVVFSLGPAATPAFSPASGNYATAQSVTLSTSTSGAAIRYTTDGSTPTETHGTVYTGPITVAVNVTTPQTLQAIAYETGYADSVVASAVYAFVAPASLSIASTHAASFVQGQIGTYTVTVSNASSAGTTSSAVTVTESLPTGLTLYSMAGAGWTCAGNTCTRNDALSAASSYPPISAIVVVVASPASSPLVNSPAVSGGGSASANANDSTAIIAPGSSWYTGWSRRKAVTINQSQISGNAALTNFPVLISLPSDANLQAEAQTNGNDILFTAADGVTSSTMRLSSTTTPPAN